MMARTKETSIPAQPRDSGSKRGSNKVEPRPNDTDITKKVDEFENQLEIYYADMPVARMSFLSKMYRDQLEAKLPGISAEEQVNDISLREEVGRIERTMREYDLGKAYFESKLPVRNFKEKEILKNYKNGDLKRPSELEIANANKYHMRSTIPFAPMKDGGFDKTGSTSTTNPREDNDDAFDAVEGDSPLPFTPLDDNGGFSDTGWNLFSQLRKYCEILHQNHGLLEDVIGTKHLTVENYLKVKPWVVKHQKGIGKIIGHLWRPEEIDEAFRSFYRENGYASFVTQDNQKIHVYLQFMMWSSLNTACHSSILESLDIMSANIQHPSHQELESRMWKWLHACTYAVKAPIIYINNLMERPLKLLDYANPATSDFCVAYVLSSLAVPRTIRYLAGITCGDKFNTLRGIGEIEDMGKHHFIDVVKENQSVIDQKFLREFLKCYKRRDLSPWHSLEVDLEALLERPVNSRSKKKPLKERSTGKNYVGSCKVNSDINKQEAVISSSNQAFSGPSEALAIAINSRSKKNPPKERATGKNDVGSCKVNSDKTTKRPPEPGIRKSQSKTTSPEKRDTGGKNNRTLKRPIETGVTTKKKKKKRKTDGKVNERDIASGSLTSSNMEDSQGKKHKGLNGSGAKTRDNKVLTDLIIHMTAGLSEDLCLEATSSDKFPINLLDEGYSEFDVTHLQCLTMYLIILRDEQPSSFAYTTIERILSGELSNMKEERRMHVPSVIYQLRQNTKLFKMELLHTFISMNAKQIAAAQSDWENYFSPVDNPNEVKEEDIDSVAPDTTSKVEEKDIVAPSKASKKGTGEKKNKKGQRKHRKSVAPNKAEQTNTQEKDIVAPSKASKKGTGEKKRRMDKENTGKVLLQTQRNKQTLKAPQRRGRN
jgi:hypothetical protein